MMERALCFLPEKLPPGQWEAQFQTIFKMSNVSLKNSFGNVAQRLNLLIERRTSSPILYLRASMSSHLPKDCITCCLTSVLQNAQYDHMIYSFACSILPVGADPRKSLQQTIS